MYVVQLKFWIEEAFIQDTGNEVHAVQSGLNFDIYFRILVIFQHQRFQEKQGDLIIHYCKIVIIIYNENILLFTSELRSFR